MRITALGCSELAQSTPCWWSDMDLSFPIPDIRQVALSTHCLKTLSVRLINQIGSKFAIDFHAAIG